MCMFLSLRKKIGLRVNNSPQKINKPEILKCINNDPLNKDNRKIDGTINSFSTFIIPEHQKIIEDGSMLVSPIPEFVPEQLFEMFSSIDSELDTTKAFQNAKTELAFYIFSFNFIGNHPYSRFISLITCLEILSTEPKSSTLTCKMIDKLNNFLKDYKKRETSVSGKKEIDRLIDRVGNLKNESIRLAVCSLLFNHYDKNDPEHEKFDITNAIECNNITKKLYTLRSNLVHGGKPSKNFKASDPQDFFDQLKILEGITQDILYAEFKNQYFIKEEVT